MIRLAALVAVTVSLLGCARPLPTLSRSEALQCRANGGFQSRAPFGTPICEVPYADAGKTCTEKTDCLGRCLLQLTGTAATNPKPGTPVTGRCEASNATFGCFTTVEDGKTTDAGVCVD